MLVLAESTVNSSGSTSGACLTWTAAEWTWGAMIDRLLHVAAPPTFLLTGRKWRPSGILVPLANCDIWITQVMNKTCSSWHFKGQPVYLTQYKAGYVASLMVIWKTASQWIKPGVNEETETGMGFDWLGNAVWWIYVRSGMENGNIWQLEILMQAEILMY